MICALTKWFISNSLDSDKEVPGFVRNHLKKCGSCRAFLQFSQTLEEKAALDAASVIRETPDSVLDKVKPTVFKPPQPQVKSRRRRTLVPVVSISMAAILIILFVVFRPSQSPPAQLNGEQSILSGGDFFLFGKDSTPGESLQSLASQLESPFDTEWLSLKNAVKSATDRLSSRLDLKIEKRGN